MNAPESGAHYFWHGYCCEFAWAGPISALVDGGHAMFPKISPALVAASLIFGAWQAQAAPITFTTPDFALPSFSGTGLVGSVWTNVGFPTSLANRNMSFVQGFITTNTPSAAFVSTSVDYPLGAATVALDQTTTIAQFLGTDAATLTNPSVGSNPILTAVGSSVNGAIMRFTGFFRVNAAGSVFFNIGSDDGADIVIQGKQVALNDGINPFNTLSSPVEVDFTAPGLYALTIDWFDGEFTQAGLEFGTGPSNSIIGQGLLYQSPIPEPPTAMLFGAGLVAFAIFLKLRRRNT